MEGEKEKMQEGRGRDVGLEDGPDHGEPSQPRSRHSRRAAGSARREGPDGDGSLYPGIQTGRCGWRGRRTCEWDGTGTRTQTLTG